MFSILLEGLAQIILGFWGLIYGANLLLESTTFLAKRSKFSPAIIGFIIVALGTSLAEMILAIQATASGATNLTLGNVISSNIGNLTLIAGVSALIRPIEVTSQTIKNEVPMLLAAAILILFLGLDGKINRPEGFVLVLFAVLFAWQFYLKVQAKENRNDPIMREMAQLSKLPFRGKLVEGIKIIASFFLSIAGADLVINHALSLAKTFSLNELFLGLILGFGTVLPELVICITASLKRQSEIVLATVIGSSVFNILLVLAIPSISGELEIDRNGLIGIMLMTAVSLLFYFLTFFSFRRKQILSKPEGAFLVVIYLIYLLFLLNYLNK